MHFLNAEALAHHLNPKHNYLLRTNGTFRNEAASPLVQFSELDTVSELNDVAAPDDSTIETSGTPILEVNEKESIGRGNNSNIPDFLRTTIALLANQDGEKGTEIAKAFNVANSTVSQAKRGNTGNGDVSESTKLEVDSTLKTKATTRDDIEKLALQRTLATLGILTESDIECLGAKDKADVAMKLSKVADNMRPRDANPQDNRIQVVINAPPVREKVHYDVIEVG
jgi:hypothetical protein